MNHITLPLSLILCLPFPPYGSWQLLFPEMMSHKRSGILSRPTFPTFPPRYTPCIFDVMCLRLTPFRERCKETSRMRIMEKMILIVGGPRPNVRILRCWVFLPTCPLCRRCVPSHYSWRFHRSFVNSLEHLDMVLTTVPTALIMLCMIFW